MDPRQPGRLPRVLMVTGAYHPEISSGGVQCRGIVEQLRGRADVRVLTTAVDASLPRYEVIDGVPVTRIRVDIRSRWSKLRAARRMVADLARLVRACDLVHLHGYSTKNVLVTMAAKAFHKPVVMSLHTSGFDEPQFIERHGPLARWSFRSADLYLGVSRGLVESYLAAGFPVDRVLHVPNGIDIARFAPASADERINLRRKLQLPLDQPVVIFVGFFSADKQPRVLFDAWLALRARGGPLPWLLFVGATRSPYFEVDDRIAPAMATDASACGVSDRLCFAGVTHDVPSYLRAADVFVLPSRREGMPVALLEAMACGLPCVASRLPGSTDIIVQHDVNGLLTTPGNVAELSSMIAALLADPHRRQRLGGEARAAVLANYSSTIVADRWLEAYGLLPAIAR